MNMKGNYTNNFNKRKKHELFKGAIYVILFALNISVLILWALEPELTIMQVFLKYWIVLAINVGLLFVTSYKESRFYNKNRKKH